MIFFQEEQVISVKHEDLWLGEITHMCQNDHFGLFDINDVFGIPHWISRYDDMCVKKCIKAQRIWQIEKAEIGGWHWLHKKLTFAHRGEGVWKGPNLLM